MEIQESFPIINTGLISLLMLIVLVTFGRMSDRKGKE